MQLRRNKRKSMASVTNIYAAIQEKAYENDGEGGNILNWSTVAGYENVPMSIWPMSEERKAELRSYNVEATCYIKVRYGVNIVESNNRIKYGSRLFELLSIADIQEKNIEQLVIVREYRE